MSDSVLERERKYLVIDKTVIDGLPGSRIVQGYLVVTPKVEVRVRTGPAGQKIAVKSSPDSSKPVQRVEEEFILKDRLLAYACIEACDGRVLVKTRYVKNEVWADNTSDIWTIDEYHADNEGLFVAEYEYPEGADPAVPPRQPKWVGREVTSEQRFYGQELSIRPYREWAPEERRGT